MNMNEYQMQAALFANHELLPDVKLAVWGLGVAGEAGEVADLIKKKVGHGHELDLEKVRKELGDVLWYVAAISTHCNIDLEEVAAINLGKLKKRYPGGFSSEASQSREGEANESSQS